MHLFDEVYSTECTRKRVEARARGYTRRYKGATPAPEGAPVGRSLYVYDMDEEGRRSVE